jgi:hypothetical protein
LRREKNSSVVRGRENPLVLLKKVSGPLGENKDILEDTLISQKVSLSDWAGRGVPVGFLLYLWRQLKKIMSSGDLFLKLNTQNVYTFLTKLKNNICKSSNAK